MYSLYHLSRFHLTLRILQAQKNRLKNRFFINLLGLLKHVYEQQILEGLNQEAQVPLAVEPQQLLRCRLRNRRL